MLAPEVFEIRADGLCHILVEEPGSELETQVKQAVDSCPTQAISIA